MSLLLAVRLSAGTCAAAAVRTAEVSLLDVGSIRFPSMIASDPCDRLSYPRTPSFVCVVSRLERLSDRDRAARAAPEGRPRDRHSVAGGSIDTWLGETKGRPGRRAGTCVVVAAACSCSRSCLWLARRCQSASSFARSSAMMRWLCYHKLGRHADAEASLGK
jgi:hypothetical protein